MDCLRCGLINPDYARHCDCGYDFATKSVKSSYLADSQDVSELAIEVVRALGRRDLMVGGMWLALGTVATIGSYAVAATQGGSYVVTYGAIAVGVVRVARGLYRTQSSRPTSLLSR